MYQKLYTVYTMYMYTHTTLYVVYMYMYLELYSVYSHNTIYMYMYIYSVHIHVPGAGSLHEEHCPGQMRWRSGCPGAAAG